MKTIIISTLCIISIIIISSNVQTEPIIFWDPELTICDYASQQAVPLMIRSDSYSIITFWRDHRETIGHSGIYAQKTDQDGEIQWTEDGIEIFSPTVSDGEVTDICVISDDADGAIVGWNETERDSLYIQRIDGDGNFLWGPRGIGVTVPVADNPFLELVKDDDGGAIIVWVAGGYAIKAQKYNSSGTAQWTSGGITVCNPSGVAYLGEIRTTVDGSGGVIIVWKDDRNTAGNHDLFIQSVDSDGVIQWTSQGVTISNKSLNDYNANILADNSGGAIITWQNDNEIYAQKVNSSGTIQWTSNGVNISTSSTSNTNPYICSDMNSGAIIAFEGTTSSGKHYVHVTHVLSNGTLDWPVNPCLAGGQEDHIRIASDGIGGIFITFCKLIERDYPEDDYNAIVAQWINMDGGRNWGNYGIVVERLSGAFIDDRDILYDDNWGLYISWSGSDDNIYMQKVFQIPACELVVNVSDWNFDSYEQLTACPAGDTWEINPCYPLYCEDSITWYADSLQIEIDFVDSTMLKGISASDIVLCKPDSVSTFYNNQANIFADADASSPNYVTTITQKYIGAHDDNVVNECPDLNLLVQFDGKDLDTTDGFYVRSYDLTGDSIVNLCDLNIFGLSYNKSWDDPDFNCWCNYNADSLVNLSEFIFWCQHYQHVTPNGYYAFQIEENYESSLSVTLSKEIIRSEKGDILAVTIYLNDMMDIATMCLGFEYNESMMKYHGWIESEPFVNNSVAAPIKNNSGSANLLLAGFQMDKFKSSLFKMGTIEFLIDSHEMNYLSLSFVDLMSIDNRLMTAKEVDIDSDSPSVVPIYRYNLCSNFPNPFNPSTTIRYSIAKNEHVSLAIYNVKGQRIRILIDEFQNRNDYSIIWDGKNDVGVSVASGVYYCRLLAENYSNTVKMILLR